MNKGTLVKYLRIMLLNFVRAAESDIKHLGGRHEVLGSDGAWRYLTSKGSDAFVKFIDEVNTDSVIGEKVGVDKVARSGWTLLLNFEGRPDAVDAELEAEIRQQLVALRSLPRRWITQSPIKNLIFEDFTELRIGKVIFRKTSDLREQTVRDLNNRLYPSLISDKQKENLSNELDRVYGEAAVCAEVVLEAESSRLPQLVDSEIDAALNLLRCYTHLLFSRSYDVRIGLEGEVLYSPRKTLSFSEHEPKPSITTHSRAIGSLAPYQLTAQAVKGLREKFSLDILSSVIAKSESERSNLERAIVTSIRWLGRGVAASDLPEKVLNFAAASERLLIGDENKSEIAERYSRRLAFLVGDTPQQRLEISIRARDLYKVRNAVIHAGKTDISQEDVEEIEELTRDALLKMAQHLDEWNDHKQFAEWVEAQIFRVK